MMNQHTFTIAAPVDAVWAVLGDDFDNIGDWATAVPSSTGASRPVEIDGAPSAGRTCSVAVPGFSSVDERLVRFEPDTYALAYEVVEGMPGFVVSAVNTWQLRTVDSTTTAVSTMVEMVTRGILGKLVAPLMRLNIARTQKTLARDLTAYVETGQPSDAKQKQLARA